MKNIAVIMLTGVGILSVLFAVGFSSTTHAQQTVPYKINFQGRLTNSDGNIVADGLYNMQFRMFDADTGGTEEWSELREAGDRVQVTNGLFAVQLGDVTTIDPTLFTNPDLYFEVELPTPGTATCSTTGCATWTEGAMTPRQKIAASPYAMNADLLDGHGSDEFAKLDEANVFTADQEINVNSTTAFNVQTGGTSLLLADTTNSIVKVGTTANATLANVRLISTSAEFTGTVRVGDATDGVDISAAGGVELRGTARHAQTTTLNAEYAGAVLDAGTGSDNTGTMTAGLDLTERMNYYNWTTTQGTIQSYDVVTQVPIPSDFDDWASTTPVVISTYTSDLTDGTVQAELRDSNGTVVVNFADITPGSTGTWSDENIGDISSGTYVAGDYLTLRLRMQAGDSDTTRVGNITLDYLSKW